jgi:hypothetical protein
MPKPYVDADGGWKAVGAKVAELQTQGALGASHSLVPLLPRAIKSTATALWRCRYRDRGAKGRVVTGV